MKPIYPPQSVGKYSVSKKEFLQTPRSMNAVDLSILHDTQALYSQLRSLKDFFSTLIPTKLCLLPPSGWPEFHLMSLYNVDISSKVLTLENLLTIFT